MLDMNKAFVAHVATLAQGWARSAGVSLKQRDRLTMADAAVRDPRMTPEQRVLMAVACDIYDALCATPDGRQALANLGLQPVSQQREGE